MNEMLDNRMRQILAICKEPHTSRSIADQLFLTKSQVEYVVKALRDANCLSAQPLGRKTRFGWVPTYTTIADGPLPTVSKYAHVQDKAGFTGIQENIGWLISYPTEQPKGGRTVLLGEAYHTVGNPTKLSAWHGYSAEVMG